ncbi:1-phosphofructokinase [Hoyosella subflava]|uniref:1-phosphofructokinase n=1 Tax=Hoyosella subflava (strain DSM 45089 / JCM 17490 / NBRC 109087 / DQS3-9A1) TaxID=443218 RepID=F6EG50_HOYSD|nr:1-phosphofructokinase [Hoyosella subflava]AEF38752.1 1-phosphofructokinase [Hoyosella subflava DQS3-9A1]
MIITITANPSLDRTVEVAVLQRGEVQRVTNTHVHAGGKGVNISRALVTHGTETAAVLFVGGPAGDELASLLRREAVPTVPVMISSDIRSNITIAEADGTTTKLNAAGPLLSASDIDHLVTAATSVINSGADWIAGCGSLPPGAPTDFYAQLIEHAHQHGAQVAIDSSGKALEASLSAGPDVIKPNLEELAECARRDITTIGDAIEAAHVLRARGARTVLATLGAAGVLLVDDTEELHAAAELPGPVLSTVGAGDATLAGFLAGGAVGAEALREAVAWGTTAVTLPGTRMPTPEDLTQVTVTITQPKHGTVLTERS